jgi:hypothetical protein
MSSECACLSEMFFLLEISGDGHVKKASITKVVLAYRTLLSCRVLGGFEILMHRLHTAASFVRT